MNQSQEKIIIRTIEFQTSKFWMNSIWIFLVLFGGCLVPFGGSLFAADSNKPLNSNGGISFASITNESLNSFSGISFAAITNESLNSFSGISFAAITNESLNRFNGSSQIEIPQKKINSSVFSDVDSGKSNTEFSILHAIDRVRAAHPLQDVAKLNADMGSAYLLSKKGAFDPYLVLNTREKNFGGKQYYQGTESKLSIPTFSPISAEIGFDDWQGSFTNPELNTGQTGQQYVGLNVSVLKGLITDQRRTDLRKARLFNEQSQFEQKFMLNQTASEIWADYIEWYISYKELESLKMGVSLTTQRQLALRELFLSGGCNGMDTLENSIQLNLFKARQKQEEVNLLKSRLSMSKHLWNLDNSSSYSKYIPLELSDSTLPSSVGLNFLDSAFANSLKLSNVLANVPYLNILESKVNQKELEVKLKRQDLLPKLDLKFQTLSAGLGSTDFDLNNQRFGVSFSSPLFLRKELGNLKMAKFDFRQMELEYQFKQNETQLKIKSLKFQVQNNRELLKQYNAIAQGYKELYEMEKEKFFNGDGSVFLINTRELRFLDAQIKSIEQEKKYLKSIVEFLNATGEIQYSVF